MLVLVITLMTNFVNGQTYTLDTSKKVFQYYISTSNTRTDIMCANGG